MVLDLIFGNHHGPSFPKCSFVLFHGRYLGCFLIFMLRIHTRMSVGRCVDFGSLCGVLVQMTTDDEKFHA